MSTHRRALAFLTSGNDPQVIQSVGLARSIRQSGNVAPLFFLTDNLSSDSTRRLETAGYTVLDVSALLHGARAAFAGCRHPFGKLCKPFVIRAFLELHPDAAATLIYTDPDVVVQKRVEASLREKLPSRGALLGAERQPTSQLEYPTRKLRLAAQEGNLDPDDLMAPDVEINTGVIIGSDCQLRTLTTAWCDAMLSPQWSRYSNLEVLALSWHDQDYFRAFVRSGLLQEGLHWERAGEDMVTHLTGTMRNGAYLSFPELRYRLRGSHTEPVFVHFAGGSSRDYLLQSGRYGELIQYLHLTLRRGWGRIARFIRRKNGTSSS